MLVILIIGIIFALLIGVVDYEWGLTLFILAVFCVIALFIGGLYGNVFRSDCRVERPISILASIKDQGLVEGRFFLGSGYIQEEPSFVYYKEVGQNQFQLRHIKANDPYTPVVVVEDEEKTPYVRTPVDVCRGQFNLWWWTFPDESVQRVEFHIPKGSITTQFKLDSEL